MGSTEAILSAQMASRCFSMNKFMTSPVPQMQKQSDGSDASGGSTRQVERKEMNDCAAKIVAQQQQQQQKQWFKPRFALELDGLHCFETLVPL